MREQTALPLLGNQLHNSLKHRIQRLQHVIIGHTQHAKSIAFQKCIALLVLCAAADMCLTIDLDDEFRLRTEEVDDERTDNLLPPGTRLSSSGGMGMMAELHHLVSTPVGRRLVPLASCR